MATERRLPRIWLLAVVAGIIVALYWPSAVALHHLWLDAERTSYTHGYLILTASLWMLWNRRQQLASIPVASDWRAVPVLSVLAASWLLSFLSAIDLGYQLLLPAILLVAVWAVLGGRMARAASLPVTYVYFAMSQWDFVNPLAQWTTVYAVRLLLQIAGISAFFAGNQVQIAAGTFEIAGGCSGVHFLIVGAAIAVLMGDVRNDTLRTRIKLVVLMLALALLTNWVRVFVIIVAGQLTHMQSYLVKTSHYGFGWGVFAAALAVFLLIERRMPMRESDSERVVEDYKAGMLGWRPAVMAGVIAVLPLLISLRVAATARDVEFRSLPPSIAGWQRMSAGEPRRWQPIFSGASRESRAAYRNSSADDPRTVEVFAAIYAKQSHAGKLNGFGNSLAGERTLAKPMNDGTLMLTEPAGRPAMVAYRYFVGYRWYTSAARAQLAAGISAFTHWRSPLAGILAARVECFADCSAAAAKARGLLDDLSAGYLDSSPQTIAQLQDP